MRVFSTGKSLRINYYTAEKAKSVDCIKSVSCLFDKVAQVRSRSSVVLKRMFSQIFRNLQKSPFVRALSPTTKDCDLQLYLKEILNRCFPVSFAAFLSTALSQDTYFRIWVSFRNIHDSRTLGGFSFNSSLPSSPASQTHRHYHNYYKDFTSAHSQQPGYDRESLISKLKSPTVRLRALKPPGNCTGYLLETASEKILIKRKTW